MTTPRVRIQKPAKAGDVIEVRTLISHPMESGVRKDPDTGEIVPRQIIHSFVARFDGAEVFRADLHPGVAANPYLVFHMRVPGPGVLEMEWTDDSGQTWSATETIAVG